jgi:cytochrome b6-f complex iron-sulfur subunit
VSTVLFVTSRFFVRGFHASNCSHLSSLVPNSYLIVKEDKTLESYGLNAGMYSTTSDVSNFFLFFFISFFLLKITVCTHLGCVVPWSAPNNKFMCPCHGSQYAPTGAVVRGPAPLPLALAHCDTDESGKIIFSPWTEIDFRTNAKGWWN